MAGGKFTGIATEQATVPTHDDRSVPWIEVRDNRTGKLLSSEIHYVGPTKNAPKTNIP